MNGKKDFFSGIVSKLSVLMGGAVLVSGAQASVAPLTITSANPNAITVQSTGLSKPLPPKLTLKQQASGFKLIAQHSSHSSHTSHHSHHSHSSHSSSSY